MRYAVAFALLALALMAAFGAPLARQQAVRNTYYFAPEKILPMTFAHADHAKEPCATCHHNFTDGTGFGNCMTCHVWDEKVWPQLETQFHGLCRTCHVERNAKGEPSGPTRECVACHLKDDKP